jgi:hypothetical protein
MICLLLSSYVAATKQFAHTYPVMNAVSTSSRMSGAQATSSDIDFLYRIKGTSLVGKSLAVTSETLKTESHESSLGEFLQSRAVVQSPGSTIHQVCVDLSSKQLKFLLAPIIFRREIYSSIYYCQIYTILDCNNKEKYSKVRKNNFMYN